MRPLGPGVEKYSELYLYTPCLQAKKAYFYTLCAGHYFCKENYYISRNNYDSFLIIYVKKGQGYLELDGVTHPFKEGQAVFIDCYDPHTYYTLTGMEILWIHFDGSTSCPYSEIILENCGNVITLKDPLRFEDLMKKILLVFKGKNVREALISKYILQLLTDLILSTDTSYADLKHSAIIDDIVFYINENIDTPLSLNELAGRAHLSPYHFTRIFKHETGYSPYDYILQVRLNTAMHYLKSTGFSIKEICFNCGFNSESGFCTAFKKHTGVTPTEYRGAQN
ncbi:MAG: helix-turn-helix domain-containing protein [Clostridiaceae bacterium]|nr:helix-turn-helix domain-containing protein [Clostridiaceae bacterium]